MSCRVRENQKLAMWIRLFSSCWAILCGEATWSSSYDSSKMWHYAFSDTASSITSHLFTNNNRGQDATHHASYSCVLARHHEMHAVMDHTFCPAHVFLGIPRMLASMQAVILLIFQNCPKEPKLMTFSGGVWVWTPGIRIFLKKSTSYYHSIMIIFVNFYY